MLVGTLRAARSGGGSSTTLDDMSSAGWFAMFGAATLVAIPVAEYFVHRLRHEAPEEHRLAGAPQSGSIFFRSPPHFGYLSFIMSGTYRALLRQHRSLRRVGDALYCLHALQVVSVVMASVSGVVNDI